MVVSFRGEAMKTALYACLLLVLSGCQSAFGPGTPSGLRPIAAPVTLGNQPIENALVTQRESIVGYKHGYSGSITIDSKILVDIQRAGACLHLRSEVIDVDTRFLYILESFETLYRMQVNARIGRAVSYRADMDQGEVSASLTVRGQPSPEASDSTLIFNILLEQLHLGGQTVRQDEVVLRYRLGDVVPEVTGEQADYAYSLRIVGETAVAGRPVVVARAEGYVWGEDKPMRIDGVIHFDQATGVATFSDTELRHLSSADDDTRIRVVRDLSLEQSGEGRGAPARSGKCLVET
jgi:hypothetical protein